MKKLFASLLLFISIAVSSQTKSFISYAYGVDNPPAAFSFGIFNPANSGVNIYLDLYEVSIGFTSADKTDYVTVGTSIANTLPTGGVCTAYKTLNQDFTDPTQQGSSAYTAQSKAILLGQPCSGGLIGTANLGSNTYTAILTHARNSYSPDLSKTPLIIPPGKGFVIYVAPDGVGGLQGSISEGFRWRECAPSGC